MIAGIGAVLLLGAMGLPGIAALRRLGAELTPLELLAYGLPLGIVVASLAILVLAIAFGLSAALVVMVAAVSLAAAAALWPGGLPWLRTCIEHFIEAQSRPLGLVAGGRGPGASRRMAASAVTGPAIEPATDAAAAQRRSLQTGFDTVRARVSWLPMLVLGAFVVRWVFLWRGAIFTNASGMWASQINIWGDWPQHLGDVASFAYGDNFPPQHPRYAGTTYAYHYLASLTAAAMVKVGMSPESALTLHSFLFSVLILLGLYAFIRRLTRDRGIATLGTVLFLLGGGLGWWLVAGQVENSHSLWRTLRQHPWDLAAQKANNFRFENIYLANIEPQRAQLYGIPLTLLTLTLLVIAIQRRQMRLFAAAGIVAGLLPFAHLGPLPSIALIAAGLFLCYPTRLWLIFGACWAGLTLPQLYLMERGAAGAADRLSWHWAWVAAPDSFGWFWLKNLGWFAPFLLVALFTRDLVPPLARRLLWAFMPIFVVANVLSLQPDPFDNIKLLLYWFLAVAILVAALLVKAWRAYPAVVVRVMIAGIVGTMLLSGLLVNLQQAEGKDDNLWVTPEEIQLAQEVREKTPPHAIFAVGERHDDPIPMLTGRSVVMSFPGWLWTRGINFSQREQDLKAIFAFAPNTPELLKKYHIDYVVIGPDERASMGANQALWESNYPVVIQTPNYEIFAVNQGR